MKLMVVGTFQLNATLILASKEVTQSPWENTCSDVVALTGPWDFTVLTVPGDAYNIDSSITTMGDLSSSLSPHSFSQ